MSLGAILLSILVEFWLTDIAEPVPPDLPLSATTVAAGGAGALSLGPSPAAKAGGAAAGAGGDGAGASPLGGRALTGGGAAGGGLVTPGAGGASPGAAGCVVRACFARFSLSLSRPLLCRLSAFLCCSSPRFLHAVPSAGRR